MSSLAGDRFDLQKVHDYFVAALKEPDDVYMETYLEGYKELYKFFQLMGTVFGFVSSDLKNKIEILETLRKKEEMDKKFETISSMIDFEKENGLLNKNDYVSGSRTLLRLHRGLAFIREFLQKLSHLEANEKASGACQAAYNQTLAQYHPWLVRKGAVVAMYAMPTREQLLTKVCLDVEQAIIILPDVLLVAQTVYDRTETLYSDHDLHQLP